MQYDDGQTIMVGDNVKLGNDESGIVIGIIEQKQGIDDDFVQQWGYLQKGFMVEFEKYGLIHYKTPEPDLILLERSKSNRGEVD